MTLMTWKKAETLRLLITTTGEAVVFEQKEFGISQQLVAKRYQYSHAKVFQLANQTF